MNREPTTAIRRIVQKKIDYSPKSYWRAAAQCLEVAKFLIKNTKYYLDALYLAGYAAECSLKSLTLERTPRAKWAAVCEEISSGAKAHNFDFLIGILNRKQCSLSVETSESLDVIKCEWTTNLRYIGALIPYKEAEDFVNHVELICQWVKRSM